MSDTETWYEIDCPDCSLTGDTTERLLTRRIAEAELTMYRGLHPLARVVECTLTRRPAELRWNKTRQWVNGHVLRDTGRIVAVAHPHGGRWRCFLSNTTDVPAVCTFVFAATLDEAKAAAEAAVREGWT